jgi:hypothetical protein
LFWFSVSVLAKNRGGQASHSLPMVSDDKPAQFEQKLEEVNLKKKKMHSFAL